MEDAIRKNKRRDGLYHAYNLISINKDEVAVDYLAEMLEGQVAVLSSGYLDAAESLSVFNALKESALYREDQHSYILYPNKVLPLFVDRNTIDAERVKNSQLCQSLLQHGDHTILSQDIKGEYHFNGNFKNAEDLKVALNKLPSQFSTLVKAETDYLLECFENVFNHKAFTGRSGTFYGYEGLGSIYWHMVSKLALAGFETFQKAVENKENQQTIVQLREHYYEVVKGIGAHKNPEDYGAFPSDPYSHTPAGKGAQQPGMTGQVKEDILSRFGELGIHIVNGTLQFDHSLLKPTEFLKEKQVFTYFNVKGEEKSIGLEPDSLAFTYCQVPILYKKGGDSGIKVEYLDGSQNNIDALKLDKDTSQDLFNRNHKIEKITVEIKL